MESKLYHICYTSHYEVIYRTVDDANMILCRMAQMGASTGTSILAYAIMSNHVHIIVISDNIVKFVKNLRYSYTTSFNCKYHRIGRLGEKGFYCSEIQGVNHIIASISYVLRNPVHHKITPNPFEYPFTSANYYFKNQRLKILSGTNPKHHRLNPAYFHNHCIKFLPKSLSYDESGAVNPYSFLNTRMVEHFFVTYKSFHYNLHRYNYSDWAEEQLKDNNDTPICNMKTMEPMMSRDEIQQFEKNDTRWIENRKITDLEICSIIDKKYVQRYKKKSYADLSINEKRRIADFLSKKYHLTKSQAARCLGLQWDEW